MHPTVQTLMLLADGEATGGTAREARRHLGTCAACRASLAEIEGQRALAREAIEASLVGVSFQGFSARVMRSIAEERPVAMRERIRVWLGEFFSHRRAVWVPGLALASAAAVAAILFGLRGVPTPPEMGGSSVVSIQAASSAIVFDIPSQDGLSSTAVVWINDDEAEQGGSGS